ncbi:hypothetical protein BGZ46_002163 [Entomortierella lignicola]|nr:hypothetical protein BGZ46_002163 [Entomortierella lignicola]
MSSQNHLPFHPTFVEDASEGFQCPSENMDSNILPTQATSDNTFDTSFPNFNAPSLVPEQYPLDLGIESPRFFQQNNYTGFGDILDIGDHTANDEQFTGKGSKWENQGVASMGNYALISPQTHPSNQFYPQPLYQNHFFLPQLQLTLPQPVLHNEWTANNQSATFGHLNLLGQEMTSTQYYPQQIYSSIPETRDDQTSGLMQICEGQDQIMEGNSSPEDSTCIVPRGIDLDSPSQEDEMVGIEEKVGKDKMAGNDEESRKDEKIESRKRAREPHTMQKKDEILKYIVKYPNVTMSELSRKFSVPRSTLYGIIGNKKRIHEFINNSPMPSRTLETTRIAETPYQILEELLSIWCNDLTTRGIFIPDWKVSAQASEIYRMISHLLLKPLPPCKFSSRWRQKFKKRQGHHLKPLVDHQETTISDEDINEIKGFQSLTLTYGPDDIYFMDLTSMFLYPSSLDISKKQKAQLDAQQAGTANACVLLVCNKSCNNMISQIFRRPNESILGVDTYDLEDTVTQSKELQRKRLLLWLRVFDDQARRNALIVVDNSIWDLLQLGSRNRPSFYRLTILKTPKLLESLPDTNKVIREFKIRYYSLISNTMSNLANHNRQQKFGAQEFYSNVAVQAWNQMNNSTIESRFKSFVAEHFRTRKDYLGQTKLLTYNPASESDISFSLDNPFSQIPESTKIYFSIQDKDIGPSNLLRERFLQIMKHREIKFYDVTTNNRILKESQSCFARGFQGSISLIRWIVGEFAFNATVTADARTHSDISVSTSIFFDFVNECIWKDEMRFR